MAKTNFQDGTPVTPAWLNAVNNPEYKETPSNDGEIPFPPNAGAAGLSLPRQYFRNSSCCGVLPWGTSTFDFVNVDYTTEPTYSLFTKCAGLALDFARSNTDAIIWANAAGDPEVGFWFWNVAGNTPAPGNKVQFFIIDDWILTDGVYTKTIVDSLIPHEFTIQASIKNGGTATFKTQLNGALDSVIGDGRVTIIESSDDVTLQAGESATIWLRLRVNENNLGATTTPLVIPSVGFEVVTSGAIRFELHDFTVFGGNTFEMKLPADADKEFSEVFSEGWTSRYYPQFFNLSRKVRKDKNDFTPEAGVTLGDRFAVESWPDDTIRAVGGFTYNRTGVTGNLIAKIDGNPFEIEVRAGNDSVIPIADWGDDPVAIVYDDVNDETRVEFGSTPPSAGTYFITGMATNRSFYQT